MIVISRVEPEALKKTEIVPKKDYPQSGKKSPKSSYVLQSSRVPMAKRSRRQSGFYDTIEYIGPRPQKPKRRKPFGGWVILLVSLGIAYGFGRRFAPTALAGQLGTTNATIESTCEKLAGSSVFGERLAAAAIAQTKTSVEYDETFYPIAYPNGDVPANKGRSEDLVIRGYRALGLDLQQLVHEDMEKSFREYPQLFKASGPDTNVDHRRAANLQRFFERHGETLTTSNKDLGQYQAGDLVVWTAPGRVTQNNVETRIGIVVPSPDGSAKPWVVHNNGSGPVWENCLIERQILGHYRFSR
jgi:uncharacterized protein YijF (DUF1287 family)